MSLVKEKMRFEYWGWCVQKPNNHKQIYLKLGLSLLLIALTFRLFLSFSAATFPSLPLSNLTNTTSSTSSTPLNPNPPPQTQTPLLLSHIQAPPSHPPEKCDLFTGNWIPNPLGPIYTNESCGVVEHHQNCMSNGRPDSGYLYWRWKPRDCELRRFDAERFLKAMRNKSWAFIGDSISRNHVQSLLCILSQVEEAVEVYHDKEYKSKRWHFPTHNFTLSVIWSPFLAKADIFEDINGVSSSETELHLDSLDSKWTEQYPSFDYIVISGGKWFLKTAIYFEKKKIVGCHYCPGRNLTDLGFEHAYKKTLRLVFHFIIASEHKAVTFFRTSTPDHFENGEWFSGGTCKRRVPFKEGEISMSAVDGILRKIELDEFENARELASERGGVDIKLLDTTQLSLQRPDGHPGPYRQFHPFSKDKHAKVQNDCLHWCLPGPIDNWNDLVMQMVELNG